MLSLNMRNASGWLWCTPSQSALHEHLRVEASHTKEKGFSSLAHPEEIIAAAPEHCRVKTKQPSKKPYRTLGMSLMVLHNMQRTSEMSPLLALEISTPKWECALGNTVSPVQKAIGAAQHGHCSPLIGRKRNSNSKLLPCTKEHEEPRRSDSQPERKGHQISHVLTGKDALTLSKNYSLQVLCTPGVNKAHHQWGKPGECQ